MTVRSWLIAILSFWLILTLARQVFDLVGRLWISVLFNLLQIVCCLTGLFGVTQRRPALLAALAVSNLISIAQNTLILLWYWGVFGDRSKSVLSAGLPYSFSFFLRYTPGCESKFDVHRSRWVQTSCFLSYYYIEAGQAFIHILLAALSFVLTMIIFCEKKKAKMVPSMLPSSNPTYADIKHGSAALPAMKAPPTASSSINDVSSGYMNSSFDNVTNENISHDPLPPLPVYDRNNKLKRNKMRTNSLQQNTDDESEAFSGNNDFYSKLNKPRVPMEDTGRVPAGKSSGRFKKSTQQKRRATVHEEPSSDDIPEPGDIVRSSSGNLTSLISFDPKSRTLLRIREHVADEDEQNMGESMGYMSIEKGSPTEIATYEKIREVSAYASQPGHSTRKPQLDRQRNASQDSVPSIDAPVLGSPYPDTNSSDSGVPSSSCESQWPPPPARMDLWKTKLGSPTSSENNRENEVSSPGIRLLQPKEYSPGIRLTHSLGNQQRYRSSFHIQNSDNSRVVGHYHAPNEFHLTSSEKENSASPNVAIINGNGLLV
ncbi:unnamed protein product [Auanema sp. JU1783]|nr:unnamed protein product [Auanema sp. JU1783]